MGDNDNHLSARTTRRRLLRGTAVGAVLSQVPLAGSAVAATRSESSSDADVEAEPEATETTSVGAPALSVADRLADRRYVATGTRGYVVGTESGGFPPMGWHIQGEMGGVWTPPLKLLDGIWFGVDGEWLDDATSFTSGYGHVTMTFEHDDLTVERADFVPDGRRGALFGLRFDSDEDRTVTLTVDAQSELMSAYPWGWTTPSQETFNLDDEVSVDGRRLVFRETGTPPVENATEHDWAAVVGSSTHPTAHEMDGEFRGPEEAYDSAFDSGVGGRLTYEVDVSGDELTTVWIGVAGSETGPETAHDELDALLNEPEEALEKKVESRLTRQERTRLDLPDTRLQRSIDWSKQNLADSRQVATDLMLRDTDEGSAYPEPAGRLDRVRFLGAGFPDYQWLFGTDGEYTAYASVAVGQFEPIKDHLEALKEASEILNDGSGKVVHEIVTEGSMYFGANDDPGNTDETVKFPSAVALLWRWTGDDEFRDEMYDFTRRNMEYVFENLDEDDDGWLEGHGNVEREGMGDEKLDVAVYTIRGLYDLAEMARSKGDGRTLSWAQRKADQLRRTFEDAWWIPEISQHAGSLTNPDESRVYQRHWIGVTPMEVEIRRNGQPHLGLTAPDNADAALDLRETTCYSGVGDDEEVDHRTNEGLYHTGAPGCDRTTFAGTKDSTEKQIFTLNTAIMAVGEGNYGRLGRDQQGRYLDANAKLQLPVPDEQPGAMPEIAPSPAYGRSLDLPMTERAMVLQAWGAYGTVWPVVHQHLGVRPDMGRRRLEVVPHLPDRWPEASVENLRVGDGSVAVSAESPDQTDETTGQTNDSSDYTYETTVTPNVSLRQLVLGHVVPVGESVSSVTLNGEEAEYDCRRTNRGRELRVEADTAGTQRLVVKTVDC
ncbi:hypothetical protein SAMN04487948_113125 [Halogranum amylolyticum]|uniref:Glycogen debranching protein n=1 Tax=Halogranum amylolyticum TaxID=660520 RepID=A0A1H8V163_9EURY|nr:glycogen debranching protein [Halogranum amylolyticum]SEP09156.1 hypothetical protein SAMN04487948_113125 [Halogranum amylolyticum]